MVEQIILIYYFVFKMLFLFSYLYMKENIGSKTGLVNQFQNVDCLRQANSVKIN